tara:strand:+ start:2098 stop:2403 length:306 start_codon:yes stop_codon:yes gene_type:complete
MRKIALIMATFSLILSTAIIKNSAKIMEDEIFYMKENLRVLSSQMANVMLENNYLSSADKLSDYQSLYFEDELTPKDIQKIKLFKITIDTKIIEDFNIIKE